MKKITTVDLFCGAGGFTEGFSNAKGFKTLLAIDNDKHASMTFKHNHPKVKLICKNISKITNEEILSLVNRKSVDVIVGGPPCQGFSLAGRRLPNDPKNKLFKEYLRIVNALKPKVFVFENVVGLMSMRGGLVLEAICEEFTKIGYEVSYSVVNSADFGIPQARPRFILFGSRDKKTLYMPQSTHADKISGNLDLFNDLKSYITVKEALSNLPKIGQGEGGEELSAPQPENNYQKMLSGRRNKNILYNHRATRHSEKIVNRYSHMPQGGDIRSLPEELRTKKNNVFRLLDKSPARTITCNFRTDIIHPWIPRGLTTREAARLQSFDDDYQFFGNLTRKARYLTQDDQVGNAVPPLLAKAIAQHISEVI